MDTANKYDSIEELILDGNIRIRAIDIYPEMELMALILNSGVMKTSA